MTQISCVELRDWYLPISLGTYGPNDIVPTAHILDLTLYIPNKFVRIFSDEMRLVFDYDPLIAKIEAIAQQSKYETQEYLMTLIASACAKYEEILEVELFLRKIPVKNNCGSLGVRTKFTLGDLKSLRARASTAS